MENLAGKKVAFSIITVCYNCENSIEQTMKSVVNQKFRNYEYLIIDGNSTDATLNIVNNIKKQNAGKITVLSEDDEGIYEAMNKGIEMAKGQYIFFLNSGDTFYTDLVLKDVFKSLDKETDILYGDVIQVDGNITTLKRSRHKLNKLFFLMDRMVCHQAIFAKKSVFGIVGNFDTKYKISADYNWLLSCYKAGLKFKYESVIISKFDMNGISSSSHKKIKKEHEEILNEQFGQIAFLISKLKHSII